MAHDVFISYTSADKSAADAVCHRLEEAGIRCWIAPRDVGYGKVWGAEIVEAIGEARLVVVIFSAAANASRHVLDEVGTALDAGAAVIPFRIENILPTGAFRLHLNRLHWLDALSPPLDAHIDRLIETAKRNLPEAGEGEAEEARPPQQKEKEEEKKKKGEKEKGRRHRWPAAVALAAGLATAGLVLSFSGIFKAPPPPPPPIVSGPQGSTKAPALPDKVPALIHEGSAPPLIRPLPPSRTLTGHTREIWSVAFSPDGRTLASGSQDSTVKLWNVASGELLHTLTGHADAVISVAFSPDGRTLASGGETIKLWDVASGQVLRTLTGGTEGIYYVAFSPDGRTLASGSVERPIKLWDVASGQGLRTHTTIKLWDVASGQGLRTLTDLGPGADSVAFSPDGRALAWGSFGSFTADLNGSITLWDVASGQVLRRLGADDKVYSVAFSPDGRTLASGGGTIKLWDMASGQILRTLTGHTESVAFSPDGHVLASVSKDNTIKLWDVAFGELRRTLITSQSNVVTSVAFSPDRRTLASGSEDSTIELWDLSRITEVNK